MAGVRLAVMVSSTDPGGIGLWIDTSTAPLATIRYRTDAAKAWLRLVV